MNHPSTRGEIWLACLTQVHGPEVEERDSLVAVISSPVFDRTPLRIVIPISSWRPEFKDRADKFQIAASERNCLDTEHAAEFLQVSSLSTDRLVERHGVLDAEQVEEIVAGVIIAVDYRPSQ